MHANDNISYFRFCHNFTFFFFFVTLVLLAKINTPNLKDSLIAVSTGGVSVFITFKFDNNEFLIDLNYGLLLCYVYFLSCSSSLLTYCLNLN